MGAYKINIKPLGENFLLIDWPKEINPVISEELLQFQYQLQVSFPEEIIDSNATYASLCVQYDSAKISFDNFKEKINSDYVAFNAKAEAFHTVWEVPVCYDPSLAPDLISFSREKNMAVHQVIALHSKATYRIYFMGFLPGFLYLGGLAPDLHHPRKTQPRQSVPAGAVGIAGAQTGIYPQASPGGWNLIGQTPIRLFDSTQHPPVKFAAGDELVFKSIPLDRFHEIKEEVEKGEFILPKKTKGNDW